MVAAFDLRVCAARRSCVAFLGVVDRVPHLREKAGGLRQERIDHLAEKGGTAHGLQVVERLTVELGDPGGPGGPGGLRGAVLDGAQRISQRRCQHFQPNRLGQVVVHSCRQALLAVLGHRVGRHGDDAGSAVRPPFADPSGRVEAVELRHLHVHQHDVVRALLERLERLQPVPRDVGADSRAARACASGDASG